MNHIWKILSALACAFALSFAAGCSDDEPVPQDLCAAAPRLCDPKPDFDHDSVPDAIDNCVAIFNPLQADVDFDGIGTACDLDEGKMEIDFDHDGIPDSLDNCPAILNEDQADWDDDKLGNVCDEDDDNDGWLDPVDNCIHAANPTQADSDQDGNGDACSSITTTSGCPDFVDAATCQNGWVMCSEQPIAAVKRSVVIKGSGAAFYWYAANGLRYVFPNEKTYRTWFPEDQACPGIRQVSDADLAATTIGGNVTYRPGVRLIKITTDPKAYAVSRYGILHWLADESAAAQIFGYNWQTEMVDDIPDAFFVNYSIGAPIYISPYDYDRVKELQTTPTVDHDLGLLP